MSCAKIKFPLCGSHLPDGITVCVLNDFSLLMGSVSWHSFKEMMTYCFIRTRDVWLNRLLYNLSLPITMNSPKLKVKYSHCFVNTHYVVYDNAHKSFPHALFRGECRQTYFSAKDNPASFTAAVKNRYKTPGGLARSHLE